MSLLLCGVDEAGRGSVIGPLVIAAYSIHEEMIPKLARLGVADSKTLTPEQRLELQPHITSMAHSVQLEVISAESVNEMLKRRGRGGINLLEAERIVALISKIKPNRVIIDSPDRNTTRFAEYVRNRLQNDSVEIICMVKADANNPVVAAASIIAKVRRDSEIEKLHTEFGDFGSGYPSDPRTIHFIKEHLRRGSLPNIVRADWETVSKAKQFTLEEFD
ncbi:MAG: ribonuclease HII [Aigarchaeota archaeon]|nr:ribonuclease HII [Candidatus Pelearchaeum maunauluense]